MPTDLLTTAPPSADLRADPWTSVNYTFGMLLGVDDFETEQAYHRGQQRLATSWLHGAGVAWGLDVSVDAEADEVRIEPGLAFDGAGRALRVVDRLCLHVPSWFEKHREELDPGHDIGTEARLELRVILRARACLSRQVPALTDPCDGAGTGMAYSRVLETVEADLLPRPDVDLPELTHRALRVLFGIEQPGPTPTEAEQDAAAARAQVLALPGPQQPAALLQAFRRLATADVAGWAPPVSAGRRSTWAAEEDDPIVLADVRLHLVRDEQGAWTVTDETVWDTSVRPNHVPTSVLQELLCGLFHGPGAGPAASPSDPVTDSAPLREGPRITRERVEVSARTIRLRATAPLNATSVEPRAFSVSEWQNGWNVLEVREATVDAARTTITLRLRESLTGNRVRIIAAGTGPTPVLGDDLLPIAGAPGGPPGTEHDGHDFVHVAPYSGRS
ncbi:MAG TPA: hypothetical protein VJ804_09840 [Acidimicrobiales bacterium]|nr:hypothetical protein [Acidimicrobiales bacterium]